MSKAADETPKSITGLLFLSWIPRNLGAIVFCLAVVGMMGGFVGGSLGVDSLFQDSDHLVAQRHRDIVGVLLNSPSLLTGFFLYYTAFIVVFFARTSYRLAGMILPAAERRFLRIAARFVLPALLLFAVFACAWLFVGREIHRACAADTPMLADCGRLLKDNEVARIALGAAVGIVASFGAIYLSRLVTEIYIRLVDLLHSAFTGAAAASGAARPEGLVSKVDSGLEAYAESLRGRRRAVEYLLFAGPTLLVVVLAFLWPKIVPAVALFALLLSIYVFLQVFFDIPIKARYALLGLFVVFMLATGEHDRFKLTFDNIPVAGGKDGYEEPLDVSPDPPGTDDAGAKSATNGDSGDRRAPQRQEDVAAGHARDCSGPDEDHASDDYRLVDPLASLERWRLLQPRGRKPKLVLVATSGGAYRAAFWTAIILDRIAEESAADGELAGFAQAIRVISGASGGMIGAAYFTALAPGSSGTARPGTRATLEHDIVTSQSHDTTVNGNDRYKTLFPIPRDSLSPVAQQLLQKDLPSIFWPSRVALDRGKVLERQWLTLARTFRELRAGERAGWRPSMIFSPMIVETGQPLIISNLDLSSLQRLHSGEVENFFDRFPCARRTFEIATAARMNATFPFVTPAVSLPTRPERRVVDAGYYDNYGVSLAAAYLGDPRISGWIKLYTRGVILLEIRAFPIGTGHERHCVEPPPEQDPSAFESFEWLTSPVEAALRARGTSMAFRNAQELRNVRRIYSETGRHDEKGFRVEKGFIESVIFANNTPVSMNWSMPRDEFNAMEACFEKQWNQNIDQLRQLWEQ